MKELLPVRQNADSTNSHANIGGRDIPRNIQLDDFELLKKLYVKQIIEVVLFDEEDRSFFLLKMDEEISIKVMEYASKYKYKANSIDRKNKVE